ncbi:uncharacterized protein LOC133352543 [Lethenteron reissneri]|uniref:uncharacterized protein LOC133352543 n=1 Tax=Lethenteron reissneri TaxID=7753 RepID=UPI002AB70405|nr:uncharacterized protein LOC133352543 [Lethenteron reissneri]
MPRKSAKCPLARTRARERLGKTQENSRLGERGRCRRLTRLLRCRCTGEDDPVDETSPPSPPSVHASAKARVADAEGGLTGGAAAADEADGTVPSASGTTTASGGADEDREGDRRVPTQPESVGVGGACAEWRKRAASFSGSLTLSPQPGRHGGLGRRKKKLAALTSLPNVETRRMEASVSSEEEMAGIENLACGAGRDDGDGETVAGAGGGLSMPTINFIPASPSDVLEDDQFFEINSEEEERATSPPPSSDSDCVDSSGSHATVERENATGNAGDAETSEASLTVPATDTAEKLPVAVARDGAEKTAEEAEVPGGDRHGRVGAVEDATAATNAATTAATTKKKKSFRLNSEIANAQLNAFPQTHPRKGSFNEGINLLQFTEQNLDELNTKECDMRDRLVQEMQKLHLQSDSLNKTAADSGVEGSSSSSRRKALEDMESDDACAWLQAMGMERLGIVVRGSRLAGRHLTSMDPETLESLQLSTWAERERLLSALYSETHAREARAVDSLLQSLSGADLQTFTAAIAGLGQPGERPAEEETRRPRRSRHPPQGDRVSDLRGDLARIRAAIAQKEEDIARLPRLPPDTDSLQVEEREMWLLQGEMELLDLKKELLGVRSALQLRRIAEAALSAGSRSHVTASCLEREWAAASRAGETITVTL